MVKQLDMTGQTCHPLLVNAVCLLVLSWSQHQNMMRHSLDILQLPFSRAMASHQHVLKCVVHW